MTIHARKRFDDGSEVEFTIDVLEVNEEDRPFLNPALQEFRFAMENAINSHSIDSAIEFNGAKRRVEGLLKASGMTLLDLLRVEEVEPSKMPYIANAPYPRRHFHVTTRDGHTSLVQVGGFFAPGVVFCKTHSSSEGCECTRRVRLSGALSNERSLKLVEDTE